jgi:hypothetical protein
MNWSDTIKTLAGPVIGAVIALMAIWLKEFFDKRKSVQSWFEQHYIFEGIDALISHFILLEISIANLRMTEVFCSKDKSSIRVEDLSPDVISKLEAILQNRMFLVSASFIRRIIEFEFSDKAFEKNALDECFKLAKKYSSILKDLRKVLLSIELKHKTDVYDISAENKTIVTLLDSMYTSHIEAVNKLGIQFTINEKGRRLMELE